MATLDDFIAEREASRDERREKLLDGAYEPDPPGDARTWVGLRHVLEAAVGIKTMSSVVPKESADYAIKDVFDLIDMVVLDTLRAMPQLNNAVWETDEP